MDEQEIWKTMCPTCGGHKIETMGETNSLRYCKRCDFLWNPDIPEVLLLAIAINHVERKNTRDLRP